MKAKYTIPTNEEVSEIIQKNNFPDTELVRNLLKHVSTFEIFRHEMGAIIRVRININAIKRSEALSAAKEYFEKNGIESVPDVVRMIPEEELGFLFWNFYNYYDLRDNKSWKPNPNKSEQVKAYNEELKLVPTKEEMEFIKWWWKSY